MTAGSQIDAGGCVAPRVLVRFMQTDHAAGEHLLLGGWEALRIVTSAANERAA